MHKKFGAEFLFFEKVLCAGGACHPIFNHLNSLAK
jgi:glutathione peroxidase-family protein